jgi:hypothetical protein
MQNTSVFLGFYRLPNKLALMGLRPVFFVPCTLVRPGFPARCVSEIRVCKESRMKFASATKLDRKSGGTLIG